MSNEKILGLFSGMVAILLVFSYGGNLAWSAAVENTGELPSSVSVGGTDVSGMNSEKASELLEAEVAGWSDRSYIRLNTGSGSLEIPISMIDFQIEETVEQISSSGQYEWKVALSNDFESSIQEKLPETLTPHFQMEQFKDQVKFEASRLPEEALEYNAYSFVPENTEELFEEVASYSISLSETEDVESLINRIGDWRVPGKSTVSLLEQVGDIAESMEEKALSQTATAIYGSLLETPFLTEERHISLRLPDYAELGKEAAVDWKGKEDLQFTNTTSMGYYVHLELDGANLQAVWTGYPFTENIRTVVSQAGEVEPRKTIRYSTSVTPGDEVLIEEGKDGRVVEVYKEQAGEEERQLLTEDYYPPVDTVVERYPVSLLSSDENSSGTGVDGGEGDVGSSTPAINDEDSEDQGQDESEADSQNGQGSNNDSGESEENEEEGPDTDGNDGSSPPSLWEPGNDKK
ncbi:VanW family protein [Salimicrobium halophilum]|uniref:G5 domain-containing protein n=1 Tax=Salimicrobium halophilum TaxID=86666 RepID=A0A1G8PJT4_9BACI|nr:VanW family protein [Salimicrobium halophilum]SDI92475.1 G5 domain-containing protein [Salimicrobium halophilum]